jgi:hypothetical protein
LLRKGVMYCQRQRQGVEDENYVTVGGEVERKGVVSLPPARRR